MNINSVSKIKLILEINGNEKAICDLKRHLSPKTVGIIARSVPLDGNCHAIGNSIVYFDTTIDSGIERSRQEFNKGDIAFLPANGSICFFKKNTKSPKIMTPIGKITSNIDVLESVKPGDVLSLYAETG